MELITFLAVCLVIAAALVLHHQRALKKAKDIVAECVAKVDEIEKSNDWLRRVNTDVRSENAQLVQHIKTLQAELASHRVKKDEPPAPVSCSPRTHKTDAPEPPAPILHTPGFGRATRPAPARTDRNTTYSSGVGGGGGNVDVVTPAAVAMAFSAITSEPACDTSSSSPSYDSGSSSPSYDSGSSCSSYDSGSGGW